MVKETQIENEFKVYEDLKKVLSVWNLMANSLRIVLILMGILAIASTISIGAFSFYLCDFMIKVLSAVSTLFLTIIAAFGLPVKANNVRDGWRYLKKALYDYECGIINVKELIEAYEIGEKLVGSVPFNYDKPNSNKPPITSSTTP